LHTDGTAEDKIFGPGYGEFSTGSWKRRPRQSRPVDALGLAEDEPGGVQLDEHARGTVKAVFAGSAPARRTR
jgi:hypothetical protein